MANTGRCGRCGTQVDSVDRFCGTCGASLANASSRKGSSRNFLWLGVGVAITLVVATATWVLMGRGVEPDAEADGARRDSLVIGEDTRRYLQGTGQPLLSFHDVTSSLLELDEPDEEAAEACQHLVEERLPQVTDRPFTLTALAAGVPDEWLGHAMVNDIAAKRDFVGACHAQAREAFETFHSEVVRSHQRIDAVLVQLDETGGATDDS